MRQLVCICAFVLISLGISPAEQPSGAPGTAKPSARKRVFVDGKSLPAEQVQVRAGVAYADAARLAEALGASAEVTDNAIFIRTGKPACTCAKVAVEVEGEQFSQSFRKSVAGVPDQIESLRAAVLKNETAPLGPRFDAVDRQLSLSKSQVQTDADAAIYYALAYANNSLAIAYYKQARGVSSEEAQKDQLDSIMCSMESKFALMKGVLLPGGSCSVFQRMAAQSGAKPAPPPE